jgi:UrcA family protein
MKLKTALIALSLGTIFAAPAFAGSSDDVRREEVRTTDINLATFAGRKQLEIRLTSAARRVCGVGEDRALGAVVASRLCYQKAINDARSQATAALRDQAQSAALMDTVRR